MDCILPGGYLCHITDAPDDLYRKYLSRKARERGDASASHHLPDGDPLDISVHDHDDEIIAGLSAVIRGEELLVGLMWVDAHYDTTELDALLTEVVESEARRRGCIRVRVRSTRTTFYQRLGYAAVEQPANVIQFAPGGGTLNLLHKVLA